MLLLLPRRIFFPDSDNNLTINNGLTEDESIKLLQKLSNISSLEKDAKSLAKILGYLPLALTSAALYIKNQNVVNKRGFSFSNYVEVLKKHDPSFLQREEDYRKGLLYERTQPQAVRLLLNSKSPELRKLIEFISVTGGSVPKKLLEQYNSDVCKHGFELQDSFFYESLVTISQNAYYIHTVTKAVTQELVNSNIDKINFLKQVADFLTRHFEGNGKDQRYHLELRQQLFHFHDYISKQNIRELNSKSADLESCLGQISSVKEEWDDVLKYFRSAIAKYEASNDKEGVFRSTFNECNALYYQLEEDINTQKTVTKESKEKANLIIDRCNKILKETPKIYPDSKRIENIKGTIYDRIGCTYALLGELEKAEQNFAFAIEHRKNGDSLKLATTHANRSKLRMKMRHPGRVSDAKVALEIRLDGFKKPHSDVANSLELAGDLLLSDDKDSARTCYSESYLIYKTLFGEQHSYARRLERKITDLGFNPPKLALIDKIDSSTSECYKNFSMFFKEEKNSAIEAETAKKQEPGSSHTLK